MKNINTIQSGKLPGYFNFEECLQMCSAFFNKVDNRHNIITTVFKKNCFLNENEKSVKSIRFIENEKK